MKTLPNKVWRHRFAAEDYHKMLEAGVLSEDDRVELIGGEIVDMTPIGWRHVRTVNRLTMLLTGAAAGNGYVVSVQNPILLGPRDEPEPDIAVIRERPEALPAAEDVALIVEVSETTLAYDRDIKLPLYAEVGIPEVWILDLHGRKVWVHSNPAPNGYRTSQPVEPGGQLHSETVEGLSISVEEVLG